MSVIKPTSFNDFHLEGTKTGQLVVSAAGGDIAIKNRQTSSKLPLDKRIYRYVLDHQNISDDELYDRMRAGPEEYREAIKKLEQDDYLDSYTVEGVLRWHAAIDLRVFRTRRKTK